MKNAAGRVETPVQRQRVMRVRVRMGGKTRSALPGQQPRRELAIGRYCMVTVSQPPRAATSLIRRVTFRLPCSIS